MRPDIERDGSDRSNYTEPRRSPVVRRKSSFTADGFSPVDATPYVDLSAVVLVCLINFLDSLGGNISTPILPFYAQQFGATGAQIGQLFSIFACMQTVAMPVLSVISDTYGRRQVLLLSIIGSMLGAFTQAFARDYMELFLARAFNGIWAGVTAVCQIYIVDVVPQDCRVEWLNYLNSASQAAILFGPSIGAGLSVLGYNVPIMTQGMVCVFYFPLVWVYLPESPAWLRLNRAGYDSPMFRSPVETARKKVAPMLKPGIGHSGTRQAIAIFGVVAFCSMAGQMAIVSMFALYAKHVFLFDSLHVGFVVTLGAIASIVTNIWLCPVVQRRIGDVYASILGSFFMLLGALMILVTHIPVALGGFMLAYLGIAINGSAVTNGSSNLTDTENRSTVMMSVRMLKSFGAMLGPTLAGALAGKDIRYPFVCAAIFSLLGGAWQLLTKMSYEQLLELLTKRKLIGKESPLLEDGTWQDEFGTPEEIKDLGEFVADLLTSRHYRWVTYKEPLRNCLRDFFPELPVGSVDDQRIAYDVVRDQARALSKAILMDDAMM